MAKPGTCWAVGLQDGRKLRAVCSGLFHKNQHRGTTSRSLSGSLTMLAPRLPRVPLDALYIRSVLPPPAALEASKRKLGNVCIICQEEGSSRV